MRVLVLGGRGNFGSRICVALGQDAGIEVFAGSRNAGAAAQEDIAHVQLDVCGSDFLQRLKSLAPGVVIHCAGPFQGQNYHVAQACIDAGAHYIDLADGRDFVAGFANALNAAATQRGVLAISGASSVPALSSAVVDMLSARFSRIDSIHTVIAPAQRSTRGAATLAGVLSYAGKPFQLWRDGRWQTAHGWQALQRVRLPRLGTRLSALCDVPDLALFPGRYANVKTVEFRASLELRSHHIALASAAALRRAGLPLPIERLAVPLDRFAHRFDRLGSDVGGMRVRVAGVGEDGKEKSATWSVLAEHNHGPQIPCMAAILLARKLAAGSITTRGAFACMGLLSLQDFAPEFRRWQMSTQVEESILAH